MGRWLFILLNIPVMSIRSCEADCLVCSLSELRS